MSEKTRYRIYVKGYVQGVGFRWSTARQARALGITGFVKNMPDGSVFIEAEGSEESIGDFIDWCRKGPGPSFVENVEIEQLAPLNYSDFRIEH